MTRRDIRRLLDERFGPLREVQRERLIFPPRPPRRNADEPKENE